MLVHNLTSYLTNIFLLFLPHQRRKMSFIPLKIWAITLLLLAVNSGCSEQPTPSPQYLRWVGDIDHNPQMDSKDFETCSEENVYQYFNIAKDFPYEGEKPALERELRHVLDQEKYDFKDGLIRVRFIINCSGKSGRFRVTAMDRSYEQVEIPPSLSTTLIKAVESLQGWKVLYNHFNQASDYYFYIIFKLEDGKIKEILP